MRHLPLLTTSASARYRSCPRSYWYAYEECVRPVYVDDAREFGTLGHRGLEVYMLALRDGAKPLEAVERGMSEIRRIENPFTQEAHIALLCGYHSRWENSGLTVLAVEQQYVTPLRNPATGAASRTWEHAGKIDAIVRDAAGDVWVLDHKFTTMQFGPGSDYRTSLLLDPQVSNYLLGARSLGYQPVGWIHDVIKRPAMRPLKATPIEARKYVQKTGALYANQRAEDETPEEYGERIAASILSEPDDWFDRIPVHRLDDEEREAAFDLWQVGRQIADSRADRAWPRNPRSCQQYGRACDYLPLCTGTASLEDQTRYRRAKRAHEELEEVRESEQQERKAS